MNWKIGREKMNDACPICGLPPIARCRCFRADCRCAHGHSWHVCTVHQRTVHAEAPHGVSLSVCTCGGSTGDIATYAEADDRTAVRGHDGDRVEELLTHVQNAGAKTIADLAKRALMRLLHAFASHAMDPSHPGAIPPTPALVAAILAQPRLFNDNETVSLAMQLAKSIAPAHFLGRARIRLRHQQKTNSADLAPFEILEARTKRIKPLQPEAAVKWFRSTFPGAAAADPGAFSTAVQAQSFRLAVTMEQEILGRIHRVIESRLADTSVIGSGPREIEKILTEASLTPPTMSTGAYSRLVFRTPLMEAYRHGAWEEFTHPDMETDFPVWQYLGIADGRERKGPYPEKPDHHRWFGKYFLRTVSFFDVRGHEAKDVMNCRCDFAGIFRKEWERLQKRTGAVITKFP